MQPRQYIIILAGIYNATENLLSFTFVICSFIFIAYTFWGSVYNIVKCYMFILANSLHINILFIMQEFNTIERSQTDIPSKWNCLCMCIQGSTAAMFQSWQLVWDLESEASKYVSWRGHGDHRGLNEMINFKTQMDWITSLFWRNRRTLKSVSVIYRKIYSVII